MSEAVRFIRVSLPNWIRNSWRVKVASLIPLCTQPPAQFLAHREYLKMLGNTGDLLFVS